MTVVGVMLAGGLSRRMGGVEKGFQEVGGKTLLARGIARAKPQVKALVLNGNGDLDRFLPYGLPVRFDVIEGYAGPLAGILTGMEWAHEEYPDVEWIASFASDAPFLPMNMIEKLKSAIDEQGAEIACAMTDGRTHPVFALWPVRLREELRRSMLEDDMRKIDRWTEQYKTIAVEFSTDPVDPFFNINRPENIAEAEGLLGKMGE